MAANTNDADSANIDYTINELTERKNANRRILASLAFAFIIIAAGVPMWWKTTEVYRVPLPYNQIKSLNAVPIKIVSNIGIFTHSTERSELLVQELRDLFRDNEILDIEFNTIRVSTELAKNIKTPAALENLIRRDHSDKPGNFVFLEWEKFTDDVLVTSERSALISSHTSASQIHRILSLWIFRETKLKAILKMANVRRTAGDRKTNLYTSAAPAAKYDILVSVFNPRPDQQNVQWDVRAAMEAYIRPFVNDLKLLSDYALKSQWKYQVPFEFTSKQISDTNKSSHHFALSENDLPHIITSIEGKLGNSISDNPTIHLVVYVPPCSNSPLHIYNVRGERVSVNGIDSFISPKWGGIVIANPTKSECLKYMDQQERADININSEHVMHTLLYLLRKIIDIHVNIPVEKANIVPWETVTPRIWEIDSFIRTGTIHLISSATSTLQSLIQLLDGIGNIVINDDVGIAVNEAYTGIVLAKRFLQQNDLIKAVAQAKRAFIASERAFFEPSLLALLYFPDDQKYAIYIPLFLPIMIPIILSVRSIFKHFKRTKDKTATEKSVDDQSKHTENNEIDD